MARTRFHVAIIGAGLGGLAAAIGIAKAGHSVTIIERAPALAEVGAGIQVPPNATRILKRWGVLEYMKAVSDKPAVFEILSYRDGRLLCSLDLQTYSEENHGVPYLHIHRADYHNVLVDEVRRLGATVLLNSEVTRIDPGPIVHIKDQDSVQADMVIGADGINSPTRDSIFKRHQPARLTGDMAYRCVIKAEHMKSHPELKGLLQASGIHNWAGPGQHVVCYKLRGGDLFNIVIACNDTLPRGTGMAVATKAELEEVVKEWNPTLRKLISLAEDGRKGPLITVDELEVWSDLSGKVGLLGDACHATLPYLASGAALAVEDGAVLGHLFEKISDASQLPDLLIIYETLRKARTSTVVKSSFTARRTLHLPDGAQQQERDRQFTEEKPFEGFPFALMDPVMQQWLYGYDANEEVERGWKKYLSGQFSLTSGAWRHDRGT